MAEETAGVGASVPTDDELAALRDEWARRTPELKRHTWLGHEFRAVNEQNQLVTASIEHVRYLVSTPPPIQADAQPAEKASGRRGKAADVGTSA